MQPGNLLHKKKSGSKSVLTIAASRLLMSVGVCAVAGASGAFIQPAFAQTVQAQGADTTSSRSFNIPAQPLTNALAQFGRQSGLQVVFPAQVSQGVRSNAVVGSFTPDQALARLLQGTGVDGRVTREGAQVGGQQTAENSSEAPFAADGTTLLDTIVIAGRSDRNASSGSGYQGTPDWVYETPAAVSVISREAIENSPARNTRDLLDNVAGVYANRSGAQNPAIAVNVRGLQDQDRVATMIDGARQSFQRSGYGSTQRAYVDSAFLRGIEVEKASGLGVGSLGALGGSVNFRTIVADDLIREGRNWGIEIDATTGTNAYNFDGSIAAAYRFSDAFAVTAGISYKDIGAFKIGQNGDFDLSTNISGPGATILYTGQEVMSSILKGELELAPDLDLTLGWTRSISDFSTGGYALLWQAVTEDVETVTNDTLTARLAWNPADNDLFDLKANVYYNHLNDYEIKDRGIYNDILGKLPVEFTMGTLGGSIENTSRFETALGTLSFHYGAEAFHDDGKGEIHGEWLNADGQDASASIVGGTGGGKRTVAGSFFGATLEHDDWLTIAGGARYDWYDISGIATVYGARTRDEVGYNEGVCGRYRSDGTCGRWVVEPGPIYGPYYTPEYDLDINRSHAALLPHATISAKVTDWLQPFISYSHSFRPPTIMETFVSGGYSGTTISALAPNPYLLPERGRTWEIGANIAHDGVFTSDDSLRLKVTGFHREIENYIVMGQFWLDAAGQYYTSPVNLDGVTRMRGVEIEGNYDARSWYVGGSFTWIDTEFADSYKTVFAHNPGELGTAPGGDIRSDVLFVPPKYKLTLDAGVRFFEERLTLGARMNYVAETTPTIGSALPESTYGMDSYTVFDLYGSYAFNGSTKLRFAVTNLTDLAYAPAVGSARFAAPGRTATVSLNVKF